MGNEAKRVRYYRMVDSYMLNRAKNTGNGREKRIFEYLHTRLVTVSKGILSGKIPTSSPPVSGVAAMVPTNKQTPSAEPVTVAVPIMDFSSLGIDFSHSALMDYDFTQDKRFPKTVTNILDSFTQTIVGKIDSNNPSASSRETLYKQVFAVLDTKMKTTADIKERKIVQYIRNHVYLRQQERKTMQ